MSLTEVYSDPSKTTRNPNVLAKRAGVSLAEAKSFLKDQASAEVQQRTSRPRVAAYAPTGDLYGTWAADVMFLADYAGLNAGRTCILTLLELNSRYCYARGLTKATSKKTSEALLEILGQNADDYETKENAAPILRLRTDNGPEFRGEFAKTLESLGIPHERTEAETHTRLARLDRFHRTLRQMIGELFAVRGSHVWYDVLPQLLENYNNRPSRALNLPGRPHLSPAEIGPDEEETLREQDQKRAAAIGELIDEKGIEPGTRVRLQWSKTKAGSKDRFAKSHETTWTSEIYEVLQRAGPNSFIVDVPPGEVKVWPVHSLRVVKSSKPDSRHPPTESGPKIDKKVVRAQRLERRNISEAEAIAAVEAPARPRRERAPRVDYKRLGSGSRQLGRE